MNRHAPLAALTAAALLTLTACAGDAAPETNTGTASATADAPAAATETTPAEPEFYGPGTYEVAAPDGGTWTITMPADAPEGLEAHREALGIPAMYYIRIDIDNAGGTDQSGPSHMALVDAEGNTYEYASPVFTIEDWGPQMSADYKYLLADGTTEITEQEYRDLSDANYTYVEELGAAVLPGAKGTRYMIGDQPVPEQIVYGEVVEALEATPIFPMPEAEPTDD